MDPSETSDITRKNEREKESFSDDDEAVHSVRFKRKKVDGAVANAVASAASSGRGSGLYLDTIQRYMLDFDFEKVCSVSLSNLNVYACLVCGKYFQGTLRIGHNGELQEKYQLRLTTEVLIIISFIKSGRGPSSHAYFHSLHENHHVYINLNTLKVYVLPDSYEVTDSSLDDIKVRSFSWQHLST